MAHCVIVSWICLNNWRLFPLKSRPIYSEYNSTRYRIKTPLFLFIYLFDKEAVFSSFSIFESLPSLLMVDFNHSVDKSGGVQ